MKIEFSKFQGTGNTPNYLRNKSGKFVTEDLELEEMD